jgi:hypothetical protein
MPHLHQRKHAAKDGAEHHHHAPDSQRFWRLEHAFDLLVVAGIVILGAVMVYGLATASGDASWF